MRFLMLSGAGDGLGLALRLKDEGHEVAVWIKNEHAKQDYEGLLRKVTKWETFLNKDTIVVFDSTGGGRTAERLKSRGHHVFGSSAFADQLEMDRGTAFGIMQEVGIKVPKSQSFTSFEPARKYVKDASERLAFKPSSEMGPDVVTYVSYDSEDLIEMLDFFESKVRGQVEFELQEVVEGLLISTEGWFNGKNFVKPFNHTFERKQLMNNNIGPSGGCAGNVVFAVEGSNFIIDEGIRRMEPILAHNEYIGPIDLNTIVNDQGVWALEFTPRFGYDAAPAFLELLDQPFSDVLSQFARGQGTDVKLKPTGTFGSALRVTIPPYPTEKFRPPEGIPVRGLTRSDRPHLFLYNVALDDKNRLVSTKGFGVVGAFTGLGESIHQALQGPMEIAHKARIPNKQFRTDLVDVFTLDHERYLYMLEGKANELPSPQEVVEVTRPE